MFSAMKRILFCTVLFLSSVLALAQVFPVEFMRECASVSVDDKDYTVFAYKDDDGTVGMYLGLSEPDWVSGAPFFLNKITVTCIYLGTTRAEALDALDGLLALLEEDPGASLEFPARIGVGWKFAESGTATATVQKRLFGKRLRFFYTNDELSTETFVSRSTVKSLRFSLNANMKFQSEEPF